MYIIGCCYLYNCHIEFVQVPQNNWLSISSLISSRNNLHFLPFKQSIIKYTHQQAADANILDSLHMETIWFLMAILQSSHRASIKSSKTYSTALGGKGKLVETDINHRFYLLKPRPKSIYVVETYKRDTDYCVLKKIIFKIIMNHSEFKSMSVTLAISTVFSVSHQFLNHPLTHIITVVAFTLETATWCFSSMFVSFTYGVVSSPQVWWWSHCWWG